MDAKETKERIVGAPTLFAVWLGLLGLTWLTVDLSGKGMAIFVLAAPFLIASAKAFLVVDYFMRLKYEPSIFRYIFLIVFGTIAVVSFLVYQDVAYRQ